MGGWVGDEKRSDQQGSANERGDNYEYEQRNVIRNKARHGLALRIIGCTPRLAQRMSPCLTRIAAQRSMQDERLRFASMTCSGQRGTDRRQALPPPKRLGP